MQNEFPTVEIIIAIVALVATCRDWRGFVAEVRRGVWRVGGGR